MSCLKNPFSASSNHYRANFTAGILCRSVSSPHLESGLGGHQRHEQSLSLVKGVEPSLGFLLFLVGCLAWRHALFHSTFSRTASSTLVMCSQVKLPTSVYPRPLSQRGADDLGRWMATSAEGCPGPRDLVVFQTPFTGCSKMPGRHSLSVGSLPCEALV